MKRGILFFAVAAVALGAVFACSKNEQTQEQTQADPPAEEHMVLGEFVSPEDTLPRIRYFDGEQVSLNDRCAVRKVKLNTKMPPIYVNGQPIGFC